MGASVLLTPECLPEEELWVGGCELDFSKNSLPLFSLLERILNGTPVEFLQLKGTYDVGTWLEVLRFCEAPADKQL